MGLLPGRPDTVAVSPNMGRLTPRHGRGLMKGGGPHRQGSHVEKGYMLQTLGIALRHVSEIYRSNNVIHPILLSGFLNTCKCRLAMYIIICVCVVFTEMQSTALLHFETCRTVDPLYLSYTTG